MTNYYKCVSCTKTSEQQHCIIKTDGNLICPHCLDAVEFVFSICTADQPEPSIGFCDGCDELEAELHFMGGVIYGDWLCDTCKAAVIKAQTDKLKAQENKTTVEAVEDLKTSCTNHWEMIKARVFVTLLIVWLIFAIWGEYNA